MPPIVIRPPPWCRTFSDRNVSRTIGFPDGSEANGLSVSLAYALDLQLVSYDL